MQDYEAEAGSPFTGYKKPTHEEYHFSTPRESLYEKQYHPLRSVTSRYTRSVFYLCRARKRSRIGKIILQ